MHPVRTCSNTGSEFFRNKVPELIFNSTEGLFDVFNYDRSIYMPLWHSTYLNTTKYSNSLKQHGFTNPTNTAFGILIFFKNFSCRRGVLLALKVHTLWKCGPYTTNRVSNRPHTARKCPGFILYWGHLAGSKHKCTATTGGIWHTACALQQHCVSETAFYHQHSAGIPPAVSKTAQHRSRKFLQKTQGKI